MTATDRIGRPPGPLLIVAAVLAGLVLAPIVTGGALLLALVVVALAADDWDDWDDGGPARTPVPRRENEDSVTTHQPGTDSRLRDLTADRPTRGKLIMTGPPDLPAALDTIDLQLTADSDEVVLPRDAAELVACALHDLLVERGVR